MQSQVRGGSAADRDLVRPHCLHDRPELNSLDSDFAVERRRLGSGRQIALRHDLSPEHIQREVLQLGVRALHLCCDLQVLDLDGLFQRERHRKLGRIDGRRRDGKLQIPTEIASFDCQRNFPQHDCQVNCLEIQCLFERPEPAVHTDRKAVRLDGGGHVQRRGPAETDALD